MMIARLRSGRRAADAAAGARSLALLDGDRLAETVAALAAGRLEVDAADAAVFRLIEALARGGFVEFVPADGGGALVLVPCRADFGLAPPPAAVPGAWKLSRFTCIQFEDGLLAARNPRADCTLRMNGAAGAVLLGFDTVRSVDPLATPESAALVAWLARARLILPVDEAGLTADEVEPAARQWDFHELLFHSLSRLGRTEKPIGATFAFRGEIEPQPHLKPVPPAWEEVVVDLPRPDLAGVAAGDLPLTTAIEQRRSIRRHSVVPPSKAQLGEFLFRTARVRAVYPTELGEVAARPYPGGGALYEIEIYVAVDACAGIARGFYYYDPLGHRLCRISLPDAEMEAMLVDASVATAGQGRPQILLTLASRFNRFHWKYRAMSYAAQLKNVGVVYQTMYLVATAMGLAACALGIGDSDRFCRMTGLDYLEEGSIGEFMLGRPL